MNSVTGQRPLDRREFVAGLAALVRVGRKRRLWYLDDPPFRDINRARDELMREDNRPEPPKYGNEKADGWAVKLRQGYKYNFWLDFQVNANPQEIVMFCRWRDGFYPGGYWHQDFYKLWTEPRGWIVTTGSEDFLFTAWNKSANLANDPWVPSETLDSALASNGRRLDLTFGKSGQPFWARVIMTPAF
jgi:hypothetical protein